mmetsp:Transcript_2852/g.6634  ORF Transcript_2852/g.6634 Transcript_2852/m.6634 type:complete len:328 (+) Transcript_2852:1302-2285(+)
MPTTHGTRWRPFPPRLPEGGVRRSSSRWGTGASSLPLRPRPAVAAEAPRAWPWVVSGETADSQSCANCRLRASLSPSWAVSSTAFSPAALPSVCLGLSGGNCRSSLTLKRPPPQAPLCPADDLRLGFSSRGSSSWSSRVARTGLDPWNPGWSIPSSGTPSDSSDRPHHRPTSPTAQALPPPPPSPAASRGSLSLPFVASTTERLHSNADVGASPTAAQKPLAPARSNPSSSSSCSRPQGVARCHRRPLLCASGPRSSCGGSTHGLPVRLVAPHSCLPSRHSASQACSSSRSLSCFRHPAARRRKTFVASASFALCTRIGYASGRSSM